MRKPFPHEPYNNSLVLNGQTSDLKIWYGTYAWGRREWIGKLYPKGMKEKEFFNYYSQHFNSIEFRATHYETIPADTVKQRWTDKITKPGFLFCPKIPQSISHYSSFTDIEDETEAFLNSIYAFGNHLGPVLLQISERFSPKRKDTMLAYLQSLPKNLQLFLQINNPEWFEKDTYQDLTRWLRQNKVGITILDNDEKPLLFDLTVPKCWIRYTPCGNLRRLDKWFEKINEWGAKGLEEAFFFIQESGDKVQLLEELLYFKNLVDKG